MLWDALSIQKYIVIVIIDHNDFDIDPNYMYVYYYNIMLDFYQNDLGRLDILEYFLSYVILIY